MDYIYFAVQEAPITEGFGIYSFYYYVVLSMYVRLKQTFPLFHFVLLKNQFLHKLAINIDLL